MTTRGQNSAAEAQRGSRRLPLDARERKKVALLVILAGVCALVLVPQLWKSKGPSTAYADTVTASEAAVDLEAVLEEMRGTLSKPMGEGRVFETMDEALELFQGGARPLAVPVETLKEQVFGVPRTAASEAAKSTPCPAPAADDGRADQLPEELSKLSLETVLVSPLNRAAIINGQVLHVGEMLEGFRIEEIGVDYVQLERDGKCHRLNLQ